MLALVVLALAAITAAVGCSGDSTVESIPPLEEAVASLQKTVDTSDASLKALDQCLLVSGESVAGAEVTLEELGQIGSDLVRAFRDEYPWADPDLMGLYEPGQPYALTLSLVKFNGESANKDYASLTIMILDYERVINTITNKITQAIINGWPECERVLEQ